MVISSPFHHSQLQSGKFRYGRGRSVTMDGRSRYVLHSVWGFLLNIFMNENLIVILIQFFDCFQRGRLRQKTDFFNLFFLAFQRFCSFRFCIQDLSNPQFPFYIGVLFVTLSFRERDGFF